MAYSLVWDHTTNAPSEKVVKRDDDGAFIPFNEGNRDYQVYLAWLAEDNTPNPPPAPPAPPAPTTVSHRQFFQALATAGMITQDEALAAVRSGTIPAAMETFIETLSPAEQFSARMLIAGASEFDRSHPLVETFAAYNQMTEQQVEDLWRLAAGL